MNSLVMVGPQKGFSLPPPPFEYLSWGPQTFPASPPFVFVSTSSCTTPIVSYTTPASRYPMQHQRGGAWQRARTSHSRRSKPAVATSWWDRDGDEEKRESREENPWKVVSTSVASLEASEWPEINDVEKRKEDEVKETVVVEKEEKETGDKTLEGPGVLKICPPELSYSDALKTENQPQPSLGKSKSEQKDVTSSSSSQKPTSKSNVKRSKQTTSLDFGSLYEQLEKIEHAQQKSDSAGVVRKVAIGGGITSAPVLNPVTSAKAEVGAPRNPLDSTAPQMRRGKERETPKVKKPSALKKIILKEREEKRKAREAEEAAKQSRQRQLHGKRFRDYCDQILDKRVDEVVVDLLQKLVMFQDRQYHKDPQKAKAKRRIVLGLREVSKHLKVGKLKCVIVTPNLESISSAGGIDEMLQKIRHMCFEQDVPIVFALTRKGLGKAVNKKVPVSIVGIFNYDGAKDQFDHVIGLTHEARTAYVKLVAEFESESKRIEESSTSSSSRKTSFESNSDLNSRKTSSQSDSDVIGSSFLSVSAAEFVPIATAQGLPPPPPPPTFPQYIPAPPPPLPYQIHHQSPYVVSSPIYHVPGSHSGYVPYGFPLVYSAPNVDAMGSGLIEVVPAPAECPSLSDETAPAASVQSSDV
ncbi:selenocysteine insertion sequence-binding protein 2-like isoform X2 [Oscarella lobularis]|uniref:selenocysteine insertion sequence-binding protein 2-like isoform X2 n=1 Tax=Oscarella lobularis TaxID=121494 RepID=UPI003314302B